MKLEIVEAKPFHCGQILRRIRLEHREALEKTGTDAHQELRSIYDQSAFRKALFIDGRITAVGGVAGTLASAYGYVWLALSDDAVRYPVAIVREARRQLEQIMGTHNELATTVLAGDTAALRLAAFLGFHTQETETIKDRKERALRLASDSSQRIPIGNTSAIALGYHFERAA